MKVFINEKTVKIVKLSPDINESFYDHVFTADDVIEADRLQGKLLVKDAGFDQMMNVVELMSTADVSALELIVFAFEKQKTAVAYFKEHFKLIVAAGGVIRKGNDILMIYRNGMWDLPKGKAEKGETIEETATREVEEECCVTVTLLDEIGKTYHTYTHRDKRVLKKTYWYVMDLKSDELMRPQQEEGIEKVVWMDEAALTEALEKSYRSIASVMKKYKKKYAKSV